MIRFCIIGTGFSGTCMLWHLINGLIEQAIDLNQIELVTVECRNQNGVGFPYDYATASPYHLCNNPVEKMSLYNNDFLDWLIASKEYLIHNHSKLIRETYPNSKLLDWHPKPGDYYPRSLFGMYLSARFDFIYKLALKNNISMTILNGFEVVHGESVSDKFLIKAKNTETGKFINLGGFDKVLIATGHWCNNDYKKIIASPYPTKHIINSVFQYQKKYAKDELLIYIHGMGPSAVDAILGICENGEFIYNNDGIAVNFKPNWDKFNATKIKILAGSCSGIFPGVRHTFIRYEFIHLTNKKLDDLKSDNNGKIPLNVILNILDLELKTATNNQLNLENFLNPNYNSAKEKLREDINGNFLSRIQHAIALHLRRLKFYQYLSGQDKYAYDKFLDRHFIRNAVPLPLINASKLLVLIDAGILSTIKLPYDIDVTLNNNYEFIEKNSQADIIIASNGFNYKVDQHPSAFIHQLLKSKEIVAYCEEGYCTGGIGVSEYHNYRIITGKDGNSLSEILYSFGPIIQYWQNQNNYAAAFVHAAKIVAADWVEYVTTKLSH